MKKLIIAVLLCVGLNTAFGQAASLRVINNSGCIVYFTLWARAGSPCPFAGSLNTAVIAFAPGMTLYANSSAAGLPPNLYFNAAYGYNKLTTCTGTPPLSTYMVGDPCTGYVPSIPMYSITPFPGCAVCGQYYIKWRPALIPGGEAQLIFEPNP